MIGLVIGLISIFVGLLMLKFFPSIPDYQSKEFTLSGILIAIILILVGIGLILSGW